MYPLTLIQMALRAKRSDIRASMIDFPAEVSIATRNEVLCSSISIQHLSRFALGGPSVVEKIRLRSIMVGRRYATFHSPALRVLILLSSLLHVCISQENRTGLLQDSPLADADSTITWPLYKNATTNSTLSDDYSEITCFDDTKDSKPTTIPGCQPSLTTLRRYPNFGKRQTFVTGEFNRPKRPSEPPYNIYSIGSNCEIELKSYVDNVRAYFSFSDAKNLATNILQHCEETSFKRGGFAIIGKDKEGEPIPVWAVSVIGRDVRPPVAVGEGFSVAAAVDTS